MKISPKPRMLNVIDRDAISYWRILENEKLFVFMIRNPTCSCIYFFFMHSLETMVRFTLVFILFRDMSDVIIFSLPTAHPLLAQFFPSWDVTMVQNVTRIVGRVTHVRRHSCVCWIEYFPNCFLFHQKCTIPTQSTNIYFNPCEINIVPFGVRNGI